ncbi:kinase-like domain-containing protein [Mycena filopes]|nr:kinase-like domain-containing protein [Mycena filopes]
MPPRLDPYNDPEVDQNLWAYLIPLADPKIQPKPLLRMDFLRLTTFVRLGRDPTRCTLLLLGAHISGIHAEIFWNGGYNKDCEIQIKDISSGGTWVSGQRLTPGLLHTLKNGDEIGFGAPIAPDATENRPDFRYRFCDVAGQQPLQSLEDLYVLREKIGEGTGGVVYKAVEKETSTLVAVKMIEYLQTSMDIFREIAVMERARHPHILSIFTAREAGVIPPHIYIVLEYMEGGDLQHAMVNEATKRNLWPTGPAIRGLPENVCREIMYQLCHAVAFLHAQGITHRDLKPENILLRDKNMRAPYIKLADFGLAHVQKNLLVDVKMTHPCGTVQYAAPEVLNPASPGYTSLADSFSIGIMMFTMMVLDNPYDVKLDRPQWPLPRLQWSKLTTALLSPAGLDLLDHLVQPDPSKRVSPAGALTHLWLESHLPMHHALTGPYM